MDCDAKTKTLLYFYEYLIFRGEPKKISHLASKFGDKKFTEEMRDIVNSSMAGLKKLLSEYPLLFTINCDDFVSVNDSESFSKSDESRDHEREAKDFFKHKLLSYGLGVKVPIESLFGHRSQASSRIQYYSGSKSDVFIEFLEQYPETFQLTGESVLLLRFEDSECVTSVRTVGEIGHGCEKDDQILSNVCSKIVQPKRIDSFNLVHQLFDIDDAIVGNMKKVRKNTQLVQTSADCFHLMDEILKSTSSSDYPSVFSLSCMFKKEFSGTPATITLIALGFPNGKTFLLDVQTCPHMLTVGKLKNFLESERIIKVIHDCRNIFGTLFEQFETLVQCAFDTEIANAILENQKSGTSLYEVDTLSIHQLIERYSPQNSVIEESLQYQWMYRPLTDAMKICAARENLLQMQLYGAMALSIKEEKRPLLSLLYFERLFTMFRLKDKLVPLIAEREIKELNELNRVDIAFPEVVDSTDEGYYTDCCCKCYVDK